MEKKKMRKYYVEIYERNTFDESYILQSQWFETPEEADKWKGTIDYLAPRFAADVMVAEFDEDGDYEILGALQNCPE